jgi:hypothetical protein
VFPSKPKGPKNAFSAVFSTEGRVAGPCWEEFKPKGPKGQEAGVLCGSFLLKSEVFAFVGLSQNLKELNGL